MSSQADLEIAEAALRAVLDEDFRTGAKVDAMSLDHMLVHIVNMHAAIGSSPERHANVAKRLGDFAVSTSKMVDRNPQAAPKLTRLTGALLTARTRVGELATGQDAATSS
jgi:hypothetical protein